MIFVLNAQGVITQRFSSADHYNQPNVDEVLKALR